MADLDIDFQYAPALRALKYASRRWLMAALRAAKLSNYAHVILLCNDTKQAVILRSKATKNLLLHFSNSDKKPDIARRSYAFRCHAYAVRRSTSFKDFSNSFSKSPTSKPIARAPSSVAMPIINISKVSRGGGSLG